MNIYHISQNQNNDYDTFDSAVVCAPDEETARNMHPRTGEPITRWDSALTGWCSNSSHVDVVFLGVADDDIPQGVICSSFNAG